jgi:hypothetical protein
MQIGRIHAAQSRLALDDSGYRELLESLTGCRSCTEMTDRQVNHALDWLNYISGRRARQPLSFDRRAASDCHANHVRLCTAVSQIVPPGYEKSPLRSMTWQTRTCGRCAAFFEDLTIEELYKLIEGLKAIFRRAGTRGTQALDDLPLSADPPAPLFHHSATG